MLKSKLDEFRNSEYRVLVGVIIGELDRQSTKDYSDNAVIDVVKKMINNNNLSITMASPEQKLILQEENFFLSQFLPSQLTDEQIESIIRREKFKTIKDCMTFFKDCYRGLYDGKKVSMAFNNYNYD